MTRINPQNYLTTIPSLHPASNEYIQYWREQKRRCVEGFWHDGVWMPAKLYFYVNFGTIRLKKNLDSKSETYARPYLRDIEWMTLRGWTAARGFSGFLEDPNFTADRAVQDTTDWEEDTWDYIKELKPHLFRPDGSPKEYLDAISYLEKQHDTHYETPLFKNQAKNFIWVTSRNCGKSYLTSSAIIGHEFLFNGQDTGDSGLVKYDPNAKSTSVQVVGAASSHYSEGIMSKVKDNYDLLPGSVTLNSITYPSPFQAKVSGSWKLGSNVIQKYKKKIGRKWEEVGSLSTISHKSFKDNSFAAQGMRCTQMIFEEAGVFTNLEESYMHSVDNMQNGGTKYGSALFIGTGGDMSAGTVDLHKMFYNPDKYDIFSYKDTWETNKDIAFFIPEIYTLAEHKDSWGWTNTERALKFAEAKREKLRIGSDSTALYQHIQYHPLVPSEAFLSKQASVFPSQELRERERRIIENGIYELLAKKVELYYDPTSQYQGINYKLDIDNRLEDISEYPIKETKSKEGAVVIFEFPELINGTVPHGAYIIGHDPYRTDGEQGSMASIYVMKTSKYPLELGHNEIVANFIGRPFAGKAAVNEVLLKLSLFYGNAKIYFENNVGSVKEYFEKHKRLDLLASQPRTIMSKKASWDAADSNNLVYGYPISNQHVKREAIGYLRDWLLEVHHELEGKTYRNVDLIPDIGLIKELLAFNFDGNFDRVLGLCGCIIGLRETENQFKNSIFRKEDDRVDLSFITKNKTLFNGKFSDPTAFLWGQD